MHLKSVTGSAPVLQNSDEDPAPKLTKNALTRYLKAHIGDLKNCSGSRYTFNQSNGNGYSWSESEKICERFGYHLVSIENREEWNFLNQTIQTMNTEEYFIGLRKDATGIWRWLSDNSTVDLSEKGKWPWAKDEPNDGELKENCALMYQYYRKRYGGYNDVDCSISNIRAGFICECKGPTDESHTSQTAETQSSTELTVHLTLSRTESELATYETVGDCKKECEYNNINDTHRTSRSVSEMCSDVQERERKYTHLVSDEKGLAQPPSLRDENEENKDHVYAAVRKERKVKASSEASALKKRSGRSQEGTNGLPGNRASCVGLVDHTKATMNETPQASENTEYLYAVVDKTKRKKKPLQMPPAYRGLVHADLIHSRENSAKLVKEQSQTVYAHVDRVKTATVKISQPNPKETKDEEHQRALFVSNPRNDLMIIININSKLKFWVLPLDMEDCSSYTLVQKWLS
ncbi:C-type lectin domain family 4 member D [Stylophora pistillata]|uniref:C-type lectin domain family 4 member D n=1 Tax=Stylophora pistillata TaxID=50429 RepID=A0A2B4RIJ9_STYPI|nr:C-type lectin domain family 4 member D [Stylophora pistillata]